MNSSVKKNQVVLTILGVFIITFSINALIIYQDKKSDITYIQTTIQKRITNLYNEVSSTMLQRQLQMRTKSLLGNSNKIEKLQAFKNKDKEKLIELFQVQFETLKEQIKGFEIMHFYDRDGISVLRMHNLGKFGDDLKLFRSCIASVVQNPRSCSFFEVGLQGLAYRSVTPVYFKNELLGFFELGVKPQILLEKIKSVFGLQAYFLIKNEYIPQNMNKNLNTIKTEQYTLCQFCSKKDEFITKITKNTNHDFTHHSIVKDQDKVYTTIIKEIFDAQSNHIGNIVLFQDITIFQDQITNLLIKFVVVFIIASFIIYFILNGYITLIFKKLNKAKFLLDNTNDAVYVIKLEDGSITDINERASLMLGFSQKELLNKTIFGIKKPLPNTTLQSWEDQIRDLKLKHFITSRAIYLRKDGSKFPIEASLSYIQNDGEFMIAVVRDITKQLDMENKIKSKADELQRLQNIISKSVLYSTSNLDGKITSVSKAFEQLSGYKESELIGKNHSLFRNPDTPKEFYKNMWETLCNDEQFVGEIKNYTKEKGEYWIKITIDPIFDEQNNKIGYSSYRENITDKKELEYISTHDALTKIFNRAYFVDELSKKINAARRYKQQFGLVMFDIDHFKNVNDTYGHHVGDEVLKAMASCIQTHIREDDIFARWGGEEFVIIANGSDIEHLKLLIEKLQNEIMNTSFTPVPKVTVSFGLTIYQNGDNEESIQKRADKALYIAKENGRNRYEFL